MNGMSWVVHANAHVNDQLNVKLMKMSTHVFPNDLIRELVSLILVLCLRHQFRLAWFLIIDYLSSFLEAFSSCISRTKIISFFDGLTKRLCFPHFCSLLETSFQGYLDSRSFISFYLLWMLVHLAFQGRNQLILYSFLSYFFFFSWVAPMSLKIGFSCLPHLVFFKFLLW